MRNLLNIISAVLLLTSSAATATDDRFHLAVRDAVLSVVDCSNPEIIIPQKTEDVDPVRDFEETGKIPYSFEKIRLGKRVVGYRVDLISQGHGGSGYNFARLFVIEKKQLKLIFELAGPYLFISDEIGANGHYRLWHWVSDDHTHGKHYYEFRDGKYESVIRSSKNNYEGTYYKSSIAPGLEDVNDDETYDETGEAIFIPLTSSELRFKIYSQRRGFSCTTEGFDENAVAFLSGTEANYKNQDGCEISFQFGTDNVRVTVNDACDKWCGAHAYGSMNGLYYKQIIPSKPSFDCSRAKNAVEKLICSEKDLANADRELASLYKKLQSRLSNEERSKLKQEQLAWIGQRDKMCGDPHAVASCIKEKYLYRIKALRQRIETR